MFEYCAAQNMTNIRHECLCMQHDEYLALFNLQQIKFNVLQLNRMIYAVRPTQSRQPLTIVEQIMPN